jgi:hypothetical protein
VILFEILIGTLAGMLTAGIGGFVAWKKLGPETTKISSEAEQIAASGSATVVDAALSLIGPYVEQVERQEAGLDALRRRVSTLEAHVSVLELRLRENALDVPPRPY